MGAVPGDACTIVVPVFNAPAATARCLASIERHTAGVHRVVLVDDASTDPAIPALLRDFAARRPGSLVLRNDSNLGFIGSSNRGLGEAPGDTILLNSDTEVTPGWVEGLVRCRRSDPAIGIVCPLSNNATLLSIEGIAELYRLPDGAVDVDAIGDCVGRAARREYTRIPTAVGFCMLMTRELIERVGTFDPAFGRGYGEENDLSMRALSKGFEIACSDDVYVHHAGSASFSQVQGLDAERARNAELLESRWPAYSRDVPAWWRANPLRPAIERVNATAERERLPGRPRVLLVTQRIGGLGGVEEHQRMLVAHLMKDVTFTVVAPMAPSGAWADFFADRNAGLRVGRLTFELATDGARALGVHAEARDARIEAAFARLLAGGFDVVHFQSLVGWNTLGLPRLARDAGARVIVSVHDRYWTCADMNMVEGVDGKPCGRAFARGSDPGCVSCIATKATFPAGAAIPAWLDARHAASSDAMGAADTVVCPSSFAAAAMKRAFGESLPVQVISHGVPEWSAVEPRTRSSRLRVAFVGRFSSGKGGATFIEAARQLAGERFMFEAWGPIDAALMPPAQQAGIRIRGPYRHADLPLMLAPVDLVVVPTQLEEAFCLVVAESQQLGVPVAASAVGAIPERVRDGESGFLFPREDVNALVALLRRLQTDRAALEAVRAHLRTNRQRTHAECARDYLALYRG